MTTEATHEFELPASAEAARVARRLLAELEPPEALAADVALVVTELVANAVAHGAPPIQLVVNERPDAWLIEVQDASDRRPEMRTLSRPDAAGGGRGLAIVDQLAARWGVEPAPSGKRVWAAFQVDAR